MTQDLTTVLYMNIFNVSRAQLISQIGIGLVSQRPSNINSISVLNMCQHYHCSRVLSKLKRCLLWPQSHRATHDLSFSFSQKNCLHLSPFPGRIVWEESDDIFSHVHLSGETKLDWHVGRLLLWLSTNWGQMPSRWHLFILKKVRRRRIGFPAHPATYGDVLHYITVTQVAPWPFMVDSKTWLLSSYQNFLNDYISMQLSCKHDNTLYWPWTGSECPGVSVLSRDTCNHCLNGKMFMVRLVSESKNVTKRQHHRWSQIRLKCPKMSQRATCFISIRPREMWSNVFFNLLCSFAERVSTCDMKQK